MIPLLVIKISPERHMYKKDTSDKSFDSGPKGIL